MSRRPAIVASGRGRRIAGVAGLGLGQAVASGLAAFATRDVFAALHAGGAAPLAATAVVAIAGCALAGLRIAERTVAERLGCDYAAAVRERLFLHVARTPPSALALRSRGGLALRFVGDLAAVRGWVSRGLARVVSATVTLPATLLVLALLDWRLAFAGAVPIALGLATIAALGAPLQSAHRQLRRTRARLASEATERLGHGAALRVVGRVAVERNRLAARSRTLTEQATAQARLAGAARAVPDAAGGVAAAAILGTAFAAGIAPATVAGALAALGLAIQPLRSLAEARDRRAAWCVAGARIDLALTTPTLPARRRDRRQPAPGAPALVFEGVRLGNGPRIDLSVANGEVTTLVCPPGADGATLLLAAAGIEPVHEGCIRLFCRRPGALPTSAVAYVGPAAPILSGTLAMNLRLGRRNRPDPDAVARALALAELGALVERLGGQDGRVADGARNLSAGEAAQLLLARALLSEASLVLVDANGLGLTDRLLDRLITAIRKRAAAGLILAGPPDTVAKPPGASADGNAATTPTTDRRRLLNVARYRIRTALPI